MVIKLNQLYQIMKHIDYDLNLKEIALRYLQCTVVKFSSIKCHFLRLPHSCLQLKLAEKYVDNHDVRWLGRSGIQGNAAGLNQWCLDFSFSLGNKKNTGRFTAGLSHVLFHRVIIYAHFSAWNEREEHPSFYPSSFPQTLAEENLLGCIFC